MDEIKTELEFKKELFRCVRYMTNVGKSEFVEMDLGKVTIELKLSSKPEKE